MGIFDVDEKKLQILYCRAWHEAGMRSFDPRKYPYLDRALTQYTRENKCAYDTALILAMTGKRP